MSKQPITSIEEVFAMPSKGEAHWQTTLDSETVLAIRSEHINGTSIRELAVKYDTRDTTVRRILTGESWASVTGGSNVLRRTRYGAYRPARPKLTRRQVEELRTTAAWYPTISMERFARLLNVDKSTVFTILRGTNYREE